MNNLEIQSYGVTKTSTNPALKDILLRKGFIVKPFTDKKIWDDAKEELTILCKERIVNGESPNFRGPLLKSLNTLKLVLSDQIQEISTQVSPYFDLNQQNAIVASQSHGQDRWHRDIPYQDWVPQGLAAVNLLFLFSDINDTSPVLDIIEGSHCETPFPCGESIENLTTTIYLRPYDFLIMNSFLFHRASKLLPQGSIIVNNVLAPKIFSQQVDFSEQTNKQNLVEKINKLGLKDDKTIYFFLGLDRKKY